MCRHHHDLLEMAVIESLPLRQILQFKPVTPNLTFDWIAFPVELPAFQCPIGVPNRSID